MDRKFYKKIILIFIFTAAFAYVESAVVIYLRQIYYPQGFHFPIKKHVDLLLYIEVIREFATLVIMVSIGALLSKKFWEGFGYFLVIFGTWDIFFYIWLKAAINWPTSIVEPDILFLIPVPWIAPVLAPVLVSLVMIGIGIDITGIFDKGYNVKPHLIHWIIVLLGSIFILYSFMCDTNAMFYEKYPLPYKWGSLIAGLMLYLIAHIILRNKNVRSRPNNVE
ncbi:MAG: hypothetical protein ABSF32_07520 [Ignavibacteria bacterium]|jgi:hypothetical protein